jgi:VIT1/CCC1 family predicted Fe2+/Mn2+ transporter
VSVASQRDSEQADLDRERRELATAPVEELDELTELYVRRGVAADVARLVAEQLSAHDPLSAHARDELGLSAERASKPLQAAMASAAAFAVGAVFPILTLVISPSSIRIALIVAVALAGLCLLGWLGAVAGGADWRRPMSRVAIGGSLAMAITMVVGFLTHTAGG